LTEEEKAKLQLKILKKAALSPPKVKPNSAWAVLLQESHASPEGKGEIAQVSTASAAKYKSLTPAELEVRISTSKLSFLLTNYSRTTILPTRTKLPTKLLSRNG
jgi:hypothetical protein